MNVIRAELGDDAASEFIEEMLRIKGDELSIEAADEILRLRSELEDLLEVMGAW